MQLVPDNGTVFSGIRNGATNHQSPGYSGTIFVPISEKKNQKYAVPPNGPNDMQDNQTSQTYLKDQRPASTYDQY
jgi:hypothetical protein